MSASILRPTLAALAADPSATTVRKLWKALTPDERALAIGTSLADDESGVMKAMTRNAIATKLKFRPQTIATWPRTKLVSEAARLPLDDAQLLSGFLIDLHLGHRRPMMAAFLDSLGVANDAGRIDSEATVIPPQDAGRLANAADDLAARYPIDDVVTYFLTLLLQDVGTWGGLSAWLRQGAASRAT